jgi:polyisoprenoid-binding protein YceI
MNIRIAMLAPVGALSLLAAASLAQSEPAAETPQVAAGHYQIEPGHTQVIFSLSHFGFTDFSGLFSSASGSLDLDPANPQAARLDVSLPVASVLTTSPRLTEELKGGQWFDAARYPTARFVSTSVTPTGTGTADVAGNLTLHGVTQPATLHVRFVGAGVNPLDRSSTVGFSATATIKRSDFGVKQYLPMIGDDVRLSIAGAFVRT